MSWVEHAAHMREMRNACKILVGTELSEDLGENETIILKWIIGKQGRRMCTGSIWFGINLQF
jgi:hypothetical protein